MNKKTVSWLLLIALCFLYAGCGEKTDNWDQSKYDKQNASFTLSHGYAQICDNILYFRGESDHFLRYLDLESGESMVLCMKPECLHNDETCSAYLSWVFPGLSLWNERIYRIQKEMDETCALYSENIDGSDLRFEKTLNDELYVLGITNIIHDGKLYSCNMKQSVIDGEPVSRIVVYSEPIDRKGGAEPIYTGEGKGRHTLGAVYNDILYFAVQFGDHYHNKVKLYAYDTKTSKLELLHSWEAGSSFLYMIAGENAVHITGMACWASYNIKDGSFSEFSLDRNENSSYCIPCADYCIWPGLDTITTLTYDGETIYSGKMITEEVDFETNSKAPLGVYNGNLLFYLIGFGDEASAEGGADSIISVDPTNGETRVLWRGEVGRF